MNAQLCARNVHFIHKFNTTENCAGGNYVRKWIRNCGCAGLITDLHFLLPSTYKLTESSIATSHNSYLQIPVFDMILQACANNPDLCSSCIHICTENVTAVDTRRPGPPVSDRSPLIPDFPEFLNFHHENEGVGIKHLAFVACTISEHACNKVSHCIMAVWRLYSIHIYLRCTI